MRLTAKINAIVCKDITDLNLIHVTYQWKHTGHNPTSHNKIISGPSQKYVADFFKKQVENNTTWYNIKAMLRLDKATLANLIDCEDNNIPIALTIQYHQVYYQMKKFLQYRARLDTDFVSSINRWFLKITNQEDSIHISRCNVTGKGKPLAWMVTNSEAQYPVCFWLEWLKDQFGYSPSMVMIDNSDTEFAAINLVYKNTDEVDVFNTNFKILLFHWHIMKAWKTKILTKLVPKTDQQKSK
ncbi:hypothetical protein [Parasitella parasitica]|uniref:MULE transposase domain-containing protein n=1 Tax=Parasitella parasitica TaxID=35722 RepID=A0A0B7N0J3_9FUNG|nr:hypothetical protein [Parasitella parasitica]